MFVVNLFAWVLLLGFPFYGLRGGGGTLFFTGAFIFITGGLLNVCKQGLIHLCGNNVALAGNIQFTIFVLLCGLAIPFGLYMNRFFTFNFDPFDWVLGAIGGMATGIIATHFFLVFMLLATEKTPMAPALQESFVVRQVVYFDGWINLSNYVTGLGENKQPLEAPTD